MTDTLTYLVSRPMGGQIIARLGRPLCGPNEVTRLKRAESNFGTSVDGATPLLEALRGKIQLVNSGVNDLTVIGSVQDFGDFEAEGAVLQIPGTNPVSPDRVRELLRSAALQAGFKPKLVSMIRPATLRQTVMPLCGNVVHRQR